MAPGDGRPPYFGNAQFSVQQQFASRFMLEAAYVSVKGTHLGNNLISLNQLNSSYLPMGALLTQNITSTAAKASGIVAPYPGFTGSVAQALRPYPQYLNIIDLSDPNGNSTYNALQVKLVKRLSHGLTILGAYTWSKSLTDGNIAAGGGPSGQDFYNRRLEKSLSTFDQPQLCNISYTYELPFGYGKALVNRGLASKIVGGWQLTGIQQYQKGTPVQITVNNTLPIFNGAQRPNLKQGVEMTLNPTNPLGGRRFNTAAFTLPLSYTLGNASPTYNALRAPNSFNESFALIRRIQLREKITLTFRGEFFNILNRVVFSAPSGNLSSTSFGESFSQANTPRQGQVSLRLEF